MFIKKLKKKEMSHHVQSPDENEVIPLNSFLYHHISMIERKKKAINKGKKPKTRTHVTDAAPRHART